jgi:hypothetical protein
VKEPTPVREGDALDWLHEQGKQRARSVPEFDLEATLRVLRAVRNADAYARITSRALTAVQTAVSDAPARIEAEKGARLLGEIASGNENAVRRSAPISRDGRAHYVPPGELDEVHRGMPPGAGFPLPPPLDDADGYNLRPNPLDAATVPDLMECVRQYRIWAGNRGLRVMARHIGQQLSAQTLSYLLKSDQLPRLSEQMRLLIEACGGDAEDQQRFVTAWRRFKMG